MDKSSGSEVKDRMVWPKVVYEIFVNKSGIHFFYIASILIALLVVVISYKFSENNNLVAYISFAATISSLILATFAIFYAVYTNGELAKSLSNVNDGAEIIDKSSKELRSSSENLNVTSKNIGDSMNDLIRRIDDIPRFIHEKIELVNSNVEKISNNLESFQAPKSNVGSNKINLDSNTSEFIRSLSVIVKIYSLVILLSNKSGKFITEDIGNIDVLDGILGLLTTSSIFSSLGLADVIVNKRREKNTLVVSKVLPDFEKAVFDEIERRFFTESDDIQKLPDVYIQDIVEIFNYFDEEPPQQYSAMYNYYIVTLTENVE
ncbi:MULTISPECIES: hypothetical protein [unclassified Shewanella]|uniref:hypothetical protein n=1 Tax=Shewanella TaxID=22 RepID=UPI0021DB05C0|nr:MULTISPECIES: hypothetical protein [unclassified Shewanella]MCU8042734.1 hypothetical protein [Shewanella sp. SM68]MCU8047108.1 hypothetical protein [Shewanella sp. SM65]